METVRNPQLRIQALGLSAHQSVSSATSRWDPIFAKIAYRADPYSQQRQFVLVVDTSRPPLMSCLDGVVVAEKMVEPDAEVLDDAIAADGVAEPDVEVELASHVLPRPVADVCRMYPAEFKHHALRHLQVVFQQAEGADLVLSMAVNPAAARCLRAMMAPSSVDGVVPSIFEYERVSKQVPSDPSLTDDRFRQTSSDGSSGDELGGPPGKMGECTGAPQWGGPGGRGAPRGSRSPRGPGQKS